MAKKLTTEEFIEKARAVHGDRYDYSRVEYTNCATFVSIGCSIHGFFQQRPNDHCGGKGCYRCGKGSMASLLRSSMEEFVRKANEVHNSKYTYRGEYKNSSTKVEIVCPEPNHGTFFQAPSTHLIGQGCPMCGRESTGIARRSSTEEFICKANKIHQNKYTYGGVYKNCTTKVEICCPEHGVFLQTPGPHLRGSGCPRCSYILRGVVKAMSPEQWKLRASDVHKGKYDYSKAIYVNGAENITVICPNHDTPREFTLNANSHLYGTGCSECSRREMGDRRRSNVEEFIIKAQTVHGDKYSYLKATYTGNRDKVTITCPKLNHGDWLQAPAGHLSGSGCPVCNESKGELSVANVLASLNVEFGREHRFPDCKNVRPLPFDFAIFKDKGLIGLIEFQGEQHYKPIKGFGGEPRFKKLQERDAIKVAYCTDNNIPLLVIHHKDKPEPVVTKFVQRLKLTPAVDV